MSMSFKNENPGVKISVLFLLARLIMVISIPLEGLKSYGDFWNFYALAASGRPFLDLWVEFPPLFPLLSRGLYLLVGGREHSYIYTLIVVFSIFQAASIYYFQKIAEIINPENEWLNLTLTYAFLISGLFYGWAYFDSLAVFCLVLSLYLVMSKKTVSAGIVIAVGGLIKWFPLLILPAAWKWLGRKKALEIAIISVLILGVGWGIFLGFSPEFTKASLIAQGSKGSWETVWALIDGNLATGNFSPDINRSIVSSASIPTGNPAVIPTWLSLIAVGGIGFLFFYRSRLDSELQVAGFLGFTLIMFFLWSPGYSPQWTLYLLPLVILAFQQNRNILLALILVLVNLLEWPILLSRGWFHFLEEIVLLRTLIFILLAFLFAEAATSQKNHDKAIT
jgi:hypothetical protein